MGWPKQRTADALGISVPTFDKYYFAEWRQREIARDIALAEMLFAQFRSGVEGNVGAQKDWLRRHEKWELEKLSAEMERRAGLAPEAEKPAAALGKKEQALLDARAVSGIFAPPQPPGGRLN